MNMSANVHLDYTCTTIDQNFSELYNIIMPIIIMFMASLLLKQDQYQLFACRRLMFEVYIYNIILNLTIAITAQILIYSCVFIDKYYIILVVASMLVEGSGPVFSCINTRLLYMCSSSRRFTIWAIIILCIQITVLYSSL